MNKALVLSAVVLSAGALAQTAPLIIGSGGTSGVYFPVATGLSKLAADAKINASAVASKGSAFNLEELARGNQQMALAQSDIAYYAFRGTGLPAFSGKANTKLRTMATLYPEVVHVVVRRDAGITSVKDLRGKRVVVGDAGSGTEQNAVQVLDAFDVEFKDLKETIRVSPSEGINLVDAGKADALIYTVGLGATAIKELSERENVKILPISGFNVRKIVGKYPFYVRFNIPKGTYRGVTVTVPTLAVQATLVTTSDLPDDTVYAFMKATFGTMGELQALHPNLKTYFSYDRATKGLPAPLHPGAARFFKEIASK